jgi:type VI protein secretion system component VasF
MGSTWAVDLANVSAIYPWQGSELIMVIAGVVFWILWHIIQLRDEKEEFQEDVAKYGSKEAIKKALDDHSI